MTGSAVPVALFAALFDDAALFPPGNAPMSAAIPGHRRHRTSWYADFVGPFVCADTRLAEVPADVAVSVVVTGGAAAIAGLGPLPHAAALEVPGVETAADAEAAVAALRASRPEGSAGFVEVPRGASRPAVLDVLAGTEFFAKFRTGGTVASAFPSEAELAEAIVGCAARGLPFKCTAGLHHAVRHTAPDTGFEHHGFLNVLLATRAATDGVSGVPGASGASEADVAELLALRDGAAVADLIRAFTADDVDRVRRMFLSYGTCDIAEPIEDLAALGLIVVPDALEQHV